MYYLCHTKSHLYNNCNTNCITAVLQKHVFCTTNVIQKKKIVHFDIKRYSYEFIAYFLKL
uniref:Uncharacterized protein n=1 Tax=Candidatus Berkiella cookevillensis TaxID=437022 RepID=A0A0Q9YCA5_9GAMM